MKIYHPIKGRTIEVRNLVVKTDNVRTEAVLSKDRSRVESYKTKSIVYIEFTVLGRNREYQDSIPLEDFQRHNPDVPIAQGTA